MIDLPIYDKTGKQVDTLAIDEAQLGSEVRPPLLKQAYVMFHANRRQGSARTKNRGRVEGSTRKLYRQKGTGNARMGARRTNIRKGGGVAFEKQKTHEEYRLKMPKRMRKLANRNALLAKLVDNEVKCISDLSFERPETAAFRRMLEALAIDRTCLVALASRNRNAALSARNLPEVNTIRVEQLNAFEMLNHRYLVVDREGLEAFLDGSVWHVEEKGEHEPRSGEGAPARRDTAAKRTTTRSASAAGSKRAAGSTPAAGGAAGKKTTRGGAASREGRGGKEKS